MESAEKKATSIARLALIVGVMVSFVFLVTGLVMQSGAVAGTSTVSADLLLRLGILTLLATPVVRVIVLAVGFLFGRQTTFAVVGFCILLLLGASVAIGLRGE